VVGNLRRHRKVHKGEGRDHPSPGDTNWIDWFIRLKQRKGSSDADSESDLAGP
jgi:hypothetical protein